MATSPIVFAQDASPSADAVSHALGGKEFSPYVGRNYPTKVLWGDQHTHTAISVDAGTMCRLGQEDAYRFARGDEVTSTTGTRGAAQLSASSSGDRRSPLRPRMFFRA